MCQRDKTEVDTCLTYVELYICESADLNVQSICNWNDLL